MKNSDSENKDKYLFRAQIISNRSRNKDAYHQAMEMCVAAINAGHDRIQVEWVDCARIAELETALEQIGGKDAQDHVTYMTRMGERDAYNGIEKTEIARKALEGKS